MAAPALPNTKRVSARGATHRGEPGIVTVSLHGPGSGRAIALTLTSATKPAARLRSTRVTRIAIRSCVLGRIGTASSATRISGGQETSRVVPGEATAHLQRESAGVLPHARGSRVPGSAAMCLLRRTRQADSARASGERRPSETGRRSRALHLRAMRPTLRRDLRGGRPSRRRLSARDRHLALGRQGRGSLQVSCRGRRAGSASA
jgi:hypothetical protein